MDTLLLQTACVGLRRLPGHNFDTVLYTFGKVGSHGRRHPFTTSRNIISALHPLNITTNVGVAGNHTFEAVSNCRRAPVYSTAVCLRSCILHIITENRYEPVENHALCIPERRHTLNTFVRKIERCTIRHGTLKRLHRDACLASSLKELLVPR